MEMGINAQISSAPGKVRNRVSLGVFAPRNGLAKKPGFFSPRSRGEWPFAPTSPIAPPIFLSSISSLIMV